MVLSGICNIRENPEPLSLEDLPVPEPGFWEVLLKVLACGVCHTELDEIEGRTPPPALPVILGHEVVGHVIAVGDGVDPGRIGERVGVGWFFSSCGCCEYCLEGIENVPPTTETGKAQAIPVPHPGKS